MAVFERHHLKGAKEQGFSEVLSGLDLHHPPCQDLIANQAFYALAMLAYNVLISSQVAGPARRGADLAHSHDHPPPADRAGQCEHARAL